MPRVPVYERQVTTAPLPGARLGAQTSPRTFGADVGAGLGAAGEVAQKLYLEEKRKADDLAVTQALGSLTETETTLLHDPQTGALTRRGQDAFAVHEPTLAAFKDTADKLERGLANDEQRYQFRRAALGRRVSVDRQLQQHIGTERVRFYDAETDAFVAKEIGAGVAGFRDPARVEEAIGRVQGALLLHAERHGLGQDWSASKLADATTKIHAGVIERLLANGEDLAARAYYERAKDEIAGGTIANVEKALRVGSVRGESQRAADGIVLKHRDLAEALKAARAIDNPEVRDATEARVKDYFAAAKAAEAERRNDAFRRAHQVLEQAGGNLDAVPPAHLAPLDPNQRHALETRSRQIREGVEPVTDYARYYGLLQLAGTDETRSRFLKTDLLQYRHELDHGKFAELARLQANLRSGKVEDEVLDGYRTKKQVVDDALASIKIDPTPKPGTKHAQTVNAFRKRVDEEIVALQGQTGKKATARDVQEIVDRLLIQGTVPGSGWIFDDRKRLFELEPGEAFDVDVDEIPAAERQKIEEALKRANRPVTPATVLWLFKRKHLQQKPAGGGAAGGTDAAQ